MATETVQAESASENTSDRIHSLGLSVQHKSTHVRALLQGMDDATDALDHAFSDINTDAKRDALERLISFLDIAIGYTKQIAELGEELETIGMVMRRES
jgi:hypothetical protein